MLFCLCVCVCVWMKHTHKVICIGELVSVLSAVIVQSHCSVIKYVFFLFLHPRKCTLYSPLDCLLLWIETLGVPYMFNGRELELEEMAGRR